MALADTLASIVGPQQLPALARDLGFEPSWHQLSLAALGVEHPETAYGVLVGRRDGFSMFGVVSGTIDRTAGRLASALARRGALGLVAAVDPGARRIALAASTQDCPVAIMALDLPRAIDLRILERGASLTDQSAVARCLGWAAALSGRSLDQRFFDQFRTLLDLAVSSLPGTIPKRDRHALSLLALTRVLFLYFVQDRGWLDRRPRFLREELDRVLASGGNVERRFLKPLFFETLNRPAAGRTVNARRFGAIPFLNGGLFEPHPLERRWRVTLPDSFWLQAFAELFEKYHFTITAGGGPRVTIGPDMLGRVFEQVMDPETRRETGAFYTPAALVDRLVDISLTEWLARAAGCPGQEAQERLAAPDAATLRLIRRIAVLDPAVGSGAFLLGALKRLVSIRVAGGEGVGAATRAVVATNLFGVDINPNAVHLAELRLWLEMIEADPGSDPHRIEPLPNLDALIRQGDSVFERIDLPFSLSRDEAAELGRRRSEVVAATGAAKRAGLVALRRAELRAGRAAIERALEVVESQVRELTGAGRSRSLFGDRPPLDRRDRAALGSLRARRTRLRGLRRRLLAADELPWFHFGSHFADVMARGGFDLVLGNPPWVRAEALTSGQREALKRRYRWFRGGTGTRRGFTPLPDLAVVFLERAFELLTPAGVVGFLVPAKLLSAQYAAAAREALAARSTLYLVAELRSDHGFDALVYPLALVAGRGQSRVGHLVEIDWQRGRMVPQESLSGAPWLVVRGSAAAHERLPRLGDRFPAKLGVKTGADSLFLEPPPEVEPDVVRTAIRGRDLEPFRVKAGVRLLWTHDERGVPLRELPPHAARVLGPHRHRLQARADYRTPPAWSLFRVEAARARHRVVWPDLARDLAAVALVGTKARQLVPLNTCYWIPAPSDATALALAAWLNAGPIRAIAKSRATVAASGFSRFNADVIENLPLPPDAIADPELIRLAKDAQQGSCDQESLDRRVTELLAAGADGIVPLLR